ncbi:hypothetical protein F5B22DRAFT_615728 [Xylaria bambusicola]|uniref:uncharacterized protein n=1 Tax=Xylaria bambusicola TaxID=326684 RepID=UPI002007CD31|nr:uncharacterized protein F5B22DRAFT_615728 [Xylaria bambusicola]KAI0509718.1 hypothetical protein F5B22DRAFT_615728 [Xylaria bambusicola]
MGVVTYRDATAIVQLIFFVPYLVCGLFLCHRQGWRRRGGWLIIVLFSVLRIIGAAFQLATISQPTRSIYAGALVTESIGIAPLIGISIGMLGRLNGHLQKPIHRIFFILLFIASLTGIGIASGSASVPVPPDSPSPFVANYLTKTAVVIFTAEYLATGLMFLIIFVQRIEIPSPEGRLLTCVAVCSPFIIARLIYGLLAAFSYDLKFNILIGDTTIYFILSVLTEIIAVGISVVVGLSLPQIPIPDVRV